MRHDTDSPDISSSLQCWPKLRKEDRGREILLLFNIENSISRGIFGIFCFPNLQEYSNGEDGDEVIIVMMVTTILEQLITLQAILLLKTSKLWPSIMCLVNGNRLHCVVHLDSHHHHHKH